MLEFRVLVTRSRISSIDQKWLAARLGKRVLHEVKWLGNVVKKEQALARALPCLQNGQQAARCVGLTGPD
jgi:hypothetical protein